jgi:hypothetical protein
MIWKYLIHRKETLSGRPTGKMDKIAQFYSKQVY